MKIFDNLASLKHITIVLLTFSFMIGGCNSSQSNVFPDVIKNNEEFLVDFAEFYSIVTLNNQFDNPSDLSDSEKYRMFLFLYNYFSEEFDEQEIFFDNERQAYVVPLEFVNDYLKKYVNTSILHPENAIGDLYGGHPSYGYDSVHSNFIVPALDGFGGARQYVLVEAYYSEQIATLVFINNDRDNSSVNSSNAFPKMEMRIKILNENPLQFYFLSWSISEN